MNTKDEKYEQLEQQVKEYVKKTVEHAEQLYPDDKDAQEFFLGYTQDLLAKELANRIMITYFDEPEE